MSVKIPDSVRSISYGAFAGCSSLTSIEVSSNNQTYKSIDGNLYTKSGTSLRQYAAGKTATTFTIPDSVTDIGQSVFYNCDSLTSVVISNNVTNIGAYAFQECSSLTSVYYKGSLSDWRDISIGSYAWHSTNATRYYYSESQPTTSGNYWHYVDGVPTVWE